ncbi:MAG TPA: protein kinase [Planktothrix sp.]
MHEAEKLPATQMIDPDAEPKDPLIGTVLLKRYEVIEQIGTGRFSVVYKARQLLMNRMVAIKSLKRDLLDEKEVVARFKKEARALSRLRHPNIVAVFDCFESQNGRPYLVMDYLEGMSLEDLLAKDHCLSNEMSKPIFLQVCDALQHAHKHGVLHRDLKPGNMVLLAETKGTELVQLVDFGLAQVEEEVQKLTQDGECCGSPAYMSPEHCTGEPLDGRSDVYSFGVVMYETLTGVVPFKGRTSVETMRLQVYENPPTFRKVRPDLNLPADIEETVMKCLQKEPHKRFQTAAQVKEAVQLWGKTAAPQGRPIIPAPQQTTFAPEASNGNGHQVEPEPAPAPIVTAPPQPSKTKEWASAGQNHRESHEGPKTAKLKKWTDTQQKANSLRTPIFIACLVAAVGLAVVATLMIISHSTSHQSNADDTHTVAASSSGNGDSESPASSAGTTQRPIDEDQPPSTVTIPTSPELPVAALTPLTAPKPAPEKTHESTTTAIKPSDKPASADKGEETDEMATMMNKAAITPEKASTPPAVKTAVLPPVVKPAPVKPVMTPVPVKPATPAVKPAIKVVAPPVKAVAPPKPAPAKPPAKAVAPPPAKPAAAKKVEPPKPSAHREPAAVHHAAKPASKPAAAPKKAAAPVSAARPAAAATPAATPANSSGNVHRHAYSSYGF